MNVRHKNDDMSNIYTVHVVVKCWGLKIKIGSAG